MAILPAMLAMEGYVAIVLEAAKEMKRNLIEQDRLLRQQATLKALRDDNHRRRSTQSVLDQWSQLVPGLSGQAHSGPQQGHSEPGGEDYYPTSGRG